MPCIHPVEHFTVLKPPHRRIMDAWAGRSAPTMGNPTKTDQTAGRFEKFARLDCYSYYMLLSFTIYSLTLVACLSRYLPIFRGLIYTDTSLMFESTWTVEMARWVALTRNSAATSLNPLGIRDDSPRWKIEKRPLPIQYFGRYWCHSGYQEVSNHIWRLEYIGMVMVSIWMVIIDESYWWIIPFQWWIIP